MSTATVILETTYLVWLNRVDSHVIETTGMSIENLPGVTGGDLRDWFDDGLMASQAAREAVRVSRAGYDGRDD